ncbi:MAG: DUF4339 domain-containing protein [Polyangiaceae bacterium]|nr:DUF4339 domain-containing protein [Polyangiaceae bacterium]
MSSQQWYVKVDSRTVGPLSTDLVLRGLADGELPSSALVCRAGAYSWLPVSAVPTFATGTARPAADSGSAAGCVPRGSGRPAQPQVRETYEAVEKPGGLRLAVASASRAGLGFSVPDTSAAEAADPAEQVAAERWTSEGPDPQRLAQEPPRGEPPSATPPLIGIAGSETDSVTPIQADVRVAESANARIRPTFTLSVSTCDAPLSPGVGEMARAPAPNIEGNDCAALDDSSLAADAAGPPVATLRPVVLDSRPPGQSGDRDRSCVVTAQVVVSERMRPSELQPIIAAADSERAGAATVRGTGSLVDRIEAGAWRLEQVPGAPVRTGQPAVIEPMGAPEDAVQTQRQHAQETPATLRENPFMSQRPAVPEPSAWPQPNDALPSGRNGTAPQNRTLDGSVGGEPERSAKAFDWSRQFCSYFQMGESFELPDQRVLLRSLQLTSLDVLVQPEAMWNLAVCLALGSDALATAAADAFFHIMSVYPNRDRLEWMARVLLSRGFLPSGIPLPAGERAVRLLQACCPPELRSPLSEALAE